MKASEQRRSIPAPTIRNHKTQKYNLAQNGHTVDASRKKGEMVTMEMVTKKTLRKWQKRLGMEDWCISITTGMKPEHTRMPHTQGNTNFIGCSKEADIQIVGSQYLERSYGRKPDELYTMLHELLELKMDMLRSGDNDLQDKYVHQLIDDLARALVDAERSGRNDKS